MYRKRQCGPGAADGPDPGPGPGHDDDGNDELAQAVRHVTASLSYPLTAAWALRQYNVIQSAVRRAESAGRPLVVCVLGPSGDAELDDVSKWQASVHACVRWRCCHVQLLHCAAIAVAVT